MDKLIEKIKELEENLKKEETNRQEMEGQLAKLIEEKNALFLNLVSISNSLQCLSRMLLAPVCDIYQWCYLGRGEGALGAVLISLWSSMLHCVMEHIKLLQLDHLVYNS